LIATNNLSAAWAASGIKEPGAADKAAMQEDQLSDRCVVWTAWLLCDQKITPVSAI